MIAHALKIIVEELNQHFNNIQPGNAEDTVILGNIAALETDIDANIKNQLRNKVVATLVNLKEESSLKNTPHSRVNDSFRTMYFNPPVYVNLYVLFSVTTTSSYEDALTYLSRLVRFFQFKNVFTPSNTAAVTVMNDYDELTDFKLIMELFSPNLEELNHMWGMLGGKQYPSVIYLMRLLELKREDEVEGDGIIEEIESRYKVISPS